MWIFNPFMQKEPSGLEGRTIDVGNLKINVQKAIAEGGFSCVYVVRDAVHMSKLYALKHIICNDDESLGLVKKEISVMKSLKGHPNVVTLYAHAIIDMGRTKEAFLVMEFCEKSLVNVLENRGAAYFDEKQVFAIFRDACNAVFAMHCQSPPIAHRDLKAENLLIGSNGLWKLCDFGSTSTNHKRFEKLEEMGIEEDNIRKHTTPAYRAPEMWDLFLREMINEKVDIWALGCLLFRICYFKSAFDGESKLQVLNGNYRIPDLPKYTSSVTDLIREMLQARPDDRPDIMQVWLRVNQQLPIHLHKKLPDRPPGLPSSNKHEDEELFSDFGVSISANKSTSTTRGNSLVLPSGESKNTSHPSCSSMGNGGQLGAFWSTQSAKDSLVPEEKRKPVFDELSSHHISMKHNKILPDNNQLPKTDTTRKMVNTQTQTVKSSTHEKAYKPGTQLSKKPEIKFSQDDNVAGERPKSCTENALTFQGQDFNAFVAEFSATNLDSGPVHKSDREEALVAEVEKLKEQLKVANMEKAEITSKYEKLSAICRSQKQELQNLKQALAVRTSPTSPAILSSPVANNTERKAPCSEPNQPVSWKAFPEEPQSQNPIRNGEHSMQPAQLVPDFGTWGFGKDDLGAAHAGSPQMPRPGEGINSRVFSESKKTSEPAGWAVF
ncbi:PREDICTED: probable serine/threonine-protein kinase DDB_G0276461 isoform X2 [Lupinus angustifolius]|uniref:probable serine/threonine-protein kinase DDB_G0276461 isoform X2 n=1 Tax=Lupinus angustifolius TaxID=3871 RepID=UPI00092F000D|nr:PREDICTED: probable serine/threonine-protein kinase DDB_G0276461 isoform X2 [Lupinus angustifolius]